METIGNLIDKLTIANIRIWMAEDIKRDKNATDKQIADATRITNTANSYRTDLIQEIDETINEMISTGKLQKLYKQGSSKMYGK
jgi:ABC-type amino acid transport substrate-binding protein